jgi:hypothetical protein
MKASKLATLGLAVAATMLALVPSALAGKAPLVLEHEGTAVANGSPGSIGLLLEECGIFFNGKVVTNDSATDVLSASSSSNAECPAGESISGSITEATLSSKRKAELHGSVTVTFASGPCKYSFSKWKGSFAVPGDAFPEGTASGKLVKGGSAPTCAKKVGGAFSFTATYEPFGEPFETVFG